MGTLALVALVVIYANRKQVRAGLKSVWTETKEARN